MKRAERVIVERFLADIGRKGGLATAERHGSKALSRWGKRGGKARAAKYDAATLSAWAKRGGRPRKAEKAGA